MAPSEVWTCPTILYWAPSRLFGDGVELLLTLFGVQNNLFAVLFWDVFGFRLPLSRPFDSNHRSNGDDWRVDRTMSSDADLSFFFFEN